jgi:hypothetical protein
MDPYAHERGPARMKRQSAAETALKKQIKIIYEKISNTDDLIKCLEAKRETFVSLVTQLEDEVTALYNARVAASKRNSP